MRLVAALFLLLPFLLGQANASEVAPGTVLDKNNIEAIKKETLDGTPVADLLLPSQEKMIKEWGLTMRLVPARPIETSELLKKETQWQHGKSAIDAKTKALLGHERGIPFDDVEENDPLGGWKLAYNYLRGAWASDTLDYNPLVNLSIDAKRGVEHEMHARYRRLMTVGRLHEPRVLGDGKISKYEMNFFLRPYDFKGVGILTVQYTDGRLPDVYAYIKAVRRVRRLSSGGWADPLGATDFLTDETFALSADPRWYKDIRLVGKRKILAVAHSISPGMQAQEGDIKKRFPTMRLEEPPYWNITEEWEPREVWVVEVTPQETHLVSKKTQYYETMPLAPLIYWQEMYNRKKELWRIEEVSFYTRKGEDQESYPAPATISLVDLLRGHATVVYGSKNYRQGVLGMRPEEFTPQAIERLLR